MNSGSGADSPDKIEKYEGESSSSAIGSLLLTVGIALGGETSRSRMLRMPLKKEKNELDSVSAIESTLNSIEEVEGPDRLILGSERIEEEEEEDDNEEEEEEEEEVEGEMGVG